MSVQLRTSSHCKECIEIKTIVSTNYLSLWQNQSEEPKVNTTSRSNKEFAIYL